MEKLAYAASLTPFIPAGVKEYSREEVFNTLRSAPDPYERFKEVAKAANAGRIKLAEPWESLRVLIGKVHRELDEGKKKALFYAVLALEEAFGVYRSVLKDVAGEREKAVEKREVGEGPFKKVVYAADLGRLRQLAEKEEAAFENALKILREKLNEYAVKYNLRDLLNVEEGMARDLAEAENKEFSKLSGMNFGTKALAALMAYREYALGRRRAYGTAAGYWLEVGGSAWLLYYAPGTAYEKAERAGVERPVAVEEMLAEALRRLFLKPGADYNRGLIELLGSGKLALMLEDKTKSSYVFRLFRLEEGDKLVEIEGVRLRISMVGDGIIYALEFEDVERWRDFFRPELEVAVKAAEEVGRRLPVEDHFPYMVGWVDSDVAISEGRLEMDTSHLWQLAETHALFDWSDIAVFRINLTLEGPKPQFQTRTSLDKLNEAIRISAEGGWLHMLGTKAGLEDLMHVKSWKGLKQWVAGRWGVVVDAAVKRLGEEVRGELEALRDRLNDDKVAREVIAPALLLIQAERLGVNETTLKYFGAVISGAVDGDGYVSAAMKRIELASGKRTAALLWAAALAAHSIGTKMGGAGSALKVIVSGSDAARLAGLYFLFGPPLLEGGDERVIKYKLAEAVELGGEGLNVSWEGLRRIKGGAVADLIISAGGIAVKYNVYLRDKIKLYFKSTDRSRAEHAARLLKLAGVDVEVKKDGGRYVWRIEVSTGMLAAGREELRKTIAKIVETAHKENYVDAGKAERWLKKLEKGRVLMKGWPKYYVQLMKDGVVYRSPNPKSIEREKQRLENLGLIEDKHFTVKMPEEGRDGYVRILREGIEYIAWLAVYGSETQRKLAEAFIELILLRAEEADEEMRKKLEKIVEKGMERRSLELENIEVEVEVDGEKYKVKVLGGKAFEEDRGNKKLLRIEITAEVSRVEGGHIVDRVERKYTITYTRRSGNNAAVGYALARADAPGGREADAERYSALIKALTGKEPKVYRKSDGTIEIDCYEGHLEGFMRYVELADDIEEWLEKTSRRAGSSTSQL